MVSEKKKEVLRVVKFVMLSDIRGSNRDRVLHDPQ